MASAPSHGDQWLISWLIWEKARRAVLRKNSGGRRAANWGSEGRSFVGDCRSAERHGSARRLCAVGPVGWFARGQLCQLGQRILRAWARGPCRVGGLGAKGGSFRYRVKSVLLRFPPHATGEERTANMYRYYPVLAGRAPRRPAGSIGSTIRSRNYGDNCSERSTARLARCGPHNLLPFCSSRIWLWAALSASVRSSRIESISATTSCASKLPLRSPMHRPRWMTLAIGKMAIS
jgi:hypothetical protein